MTNLFQPLDITVSGSAKKYMHQQFIMYYSHVVKDQLESGKALDDINNDVRLTTMKPLHAQWLVDMFNYFTTETGRKIIIAGWKKAFIFGLINGSLTELPSMYPFLSIYKT
jgi:hypothetical protein